MPYLLDRGFEVRGRPLGSTPIASIGGGVPQPHRVLPAPAAEIIAPIPTLTLGLRLDSKGIRAAG